MDALRNRILVGDCRERLGELPDESVALTVTSPPYNLGKDYGTASDDRQPIGEWREEMRSVIEELFRVTVPDGKVCINVGASFETTDQRYQRVPLRSIVVELCREAGFDFFDEYVWIKHQYTTHGDGALLGSYPYPTNFLVNQRHEYILVFRKYVSEAYRTQRERPEPGSERYEASKVPASEWREYTQSVWELPRAKPPDNTDHPAVFPVELPRRLITLYSFVGDTVLDPFIGTGTTAVAAQQTGRDYLGIESNKTYVETAHDRLQTSTEETASATTDAPNPPEDIANYICDGLERQDPTDLRRISEYAAALAQYRERVPRELAVAEVAENEELEGVTHTHTGTVITKKVSCGKDSCTTCPHGPYRYRVYRDGDTIKSDYLGPA